ncbi:MAG TPA: hypothetical protein VFF31_01060 [Blastocatellia bacterium]|nr:hypothetical protein [Blastocatellia bacterium]
MTAIWNLTKRKGAYAYVATAVLIFVSLSLAQPGDRIKFVYLISGQSASGLKVTIVTPDGKRSSYTTDASGYVNGMTREGKLIVEDPVTGIRLIDRMFDKSVTEFKVPLPIRVRGTVSGFGKDPNSITVDCGYGSRLTVSDYQRQMHGLPLVPLPTENKLEGIERARVPSRWLRSKPDTRGRFVTGWFAAVDAPELLVFNNAGQTAVRTVRLPKGTRARQTILAGSITPAAGATLEVSIEASKTDLPLGLMMGVKSLGLRGASGAQTSQMLSLLNRRDMAVGQFLAKRRQIPLELGGTTKIAGLPAMQSLRLYFVGPTPGITAERTVTIPQRGIVRVRLTEDELLGKREPLVSLTGVVRVEQGGPPVKGATVVYSSYPYRYETITDDSGRFTIPRVAANRGGAVFIDAPNPQGAPPFDRITVTRPIAPLPRPGARASTAEQVFEIPRVTSGGRTFTNLRNLTAPLATSQSGSVITQLQGLEYIFPVCGSNFTQDELQYVNSPVVEAYVRSGEEFLGPVDVTITSANVEQNGLAVVNMLFPYEGEFLVFLQYTPFVFDAAAVLIIGRPDARVIFSPKNNLAQLTITVVDESNRPVVAEVEVNFPGWPYAVDPYETLTNNSGQVIINCVSRGPNLGISIARNQLLVEVNDPNYGCFNGIATLPEFSSSLQVQLRRSACGQ